MGGGWAGTLLILALVSSSGAEGEKETERWSRQATAERRQGDWVPLSCANCRPVDQSPQGSDGLPSVLTPPPRANDARLLPPPPPPPDGLLQQAATGFIQAYNQQQRKPQQQFLTETTAQSINRPQAHFLNSPQKPFVPELSLEFQPPQPSGQPQQLQFNQQLPESNPYLNQPFLLGPQFVSAPFFPPSGFSQNIQPINPAPIQPIAPISPVSFSVNKENFQVSPDRPSFFQQITAEGKIPPSAPSQDTRQAQPSLQGVPQENSLQQELPPAQPSQLTYTVNQTEKQNDENGNEEVQLLYVPVETLNQRARNLGRQQTKSQEITSQQKATGVESNKFRSQGKGHEYSTRKPHIGDQESFNTQTHFSKQQYNDQPNVQFQQQQPPTDQEIFNSQTHTVRQQFINQGQFQQPAFEALQNFKQDGKSTKEQYNFKPISQPTQIGQENVNSQFQTEQSGRFQQNIPSVGTDNFQINSQNLNQQYNNQFLQQTQQNQPNVQGLRLDQQFTTQQSLNNLQQQLPPLEQSNFNIPQHDEFRTNVNTQTTHLQSNLPAEPLLKEQPYINQPIQFNQQLGAQQQPQQIPTQKQQFSVPETPQPTAAPVTPTREPEFYTTQQSKRQRFRNSQHNAQAHDSVRNVHHSQNNQPLRKFPEDYQQPTADQSNQPVKPTGVPTHTSSPRQSWRNQHSNSQHLNQQENRETQTLNNFQSDQFQVSNVSPPSTSSEAPLQTTPAPNQPPLSVYMETNGDSMINDVLRLLKNAKTIQVLDTVGPDSPQVFVGPSNLKAPTGYIKFELPYLNTLENNRVERKVDKLPFFVAPLNFNPPPGYSKIPFPAPHVGSVVVSNVTVLQTALHEKTYGHEPVTVSSSERYLDQYTLPAEISPISPQLPSLINSLQDDIYSGSSSPSNTPTALPDSTTHQYRTRGSVRGSQRGSSDYQTSPSPTRRPHSRTRRPWDGRPQSRRQQVTTPTTTLEPSTEVPIQQFTPQPEQDTYNSESYNLQNTASPIQLQPERNQQPIESSTAFYDNHSYGNNYNQGQLVPNINQPQQAEQQAQPVQSLNSQQSLSNSDNQNVQQYYENPQFTQQTYVPAPETIHTTTLSPVTSTSVQQEEYTFKSERNSGTRRDPSRQHHQRFRGRQRQTTSATTQSYEDPALDVGNQYNQQVGSEPTYTPTRNRPRNHNQQRLVENTHFQANVPVNRYNIQTERADIGIQTTERQQPPHADEHATQQYFKSSDFKTPLQVRNQFHQSQAQTNSYDNQLTNQYQQSQLQSSQINQNLTQQHKDFINLQFAQENTQAQLPVDQFQGTASPKQLNPQGTPQVNFQQQYQQQQQFAQDAPQVQQDFYNQHFQQDQISLNAQGPQISLKNQNSGVKLASQEQQNYFDPSTQQSQQEIQTPAQEYSNGKAIQFTNDQSQFISPQENFRDSSNKHFNIQNQHASTSNNFEQVSDVTSASPQGVVVQTEELVTPNSQIVNEPETPQDQLRNVKYNKPHSRTPVESVTNFSEDYTRRGQNQYQSAEDTSDSSSTEGTTKSSLVRVRGRVRGRQRASSRVPHTTEAPNYPTTYLSRQRNNQEKEESQEYTPRKRVNYSSRQPYNRNKEATTEQSSVENNSYSSNERQSSQENHRYTEVTTTTTEPPTTKGMRRYKHILNRNKVRRTRPTESPSTSGSSGTAKFLVPTTPPPVTRLPHSTRGRIRKPVNVKTTTSTTEYPQSNSKWNEKDSFAPSAGSNEILEPLYQTRDKPQQSFGFQQTSTLQNVLHKTTPKPIAAPSPGEDDYWNQGVTIQQSTSFDFKPDFAAVTPTSFQTESGKFDGTFTPIWNGQIELQDGNYYDVFRQQQIAKNVNDQTPFSSDQQKVFYEETKHGQLVGKDNQYIGKAHEVSPIEADDDFVRERVYPVYREIIKPAETIQDETSQVFSETYEGEAKSVHEKDTLTDEYAVKTSSDEEAINTEADSESKEDLTKQKTLAKQPAKKGGRRRGAWVRVKVRKAQDMFETAESQNLASLSENAIPAVTKTTPSTLEWTPEQTTEAASTSSPTVSEPTETINFEEALKDMLKDFITNTEEGKEEGEETADASSQANNTTAETEDFKTEEETNEKHEEKQQYEETSTEPTESEKIEKEDENDDQNAVEPTKTVIPELSSEAVTQQPTTIVQTAEEVETTIEPDFTTVVNEQEYKNPPSRILGTSTTTEISLETEICYRGRCVKTKKVDSDSDLLPME